MARKTLLITDLDNTLWDWFRAWHRSFAALLEGLVEFTDIPADQLEREIRTVHQRRGTTEYSFLLGEVPSLAAAAGETPVKEYYAEVLHAQRSARRKNTELYPGVKETLEALRGNDVAVVGYTESLAFWTEWRIRHTGLDGVLNCIYSPPDHDFPKGLSVDDVRSLPADQYGLESTEHKHVPKGATKPDAEILRSILEEWSCEPDSAVYVGDSLMKDIAMAKEAGVLDLHARYGEVQLQAEYSLLQRVTHWPDVHVEREQVLATSDEIVATFTLERFDEVLPHVLDQQ